MRSQRQPGPDAPTLLTPPGEPPGQAPRVSRGPRWAWAALAGLLLLVVAVVFALPGLVERFPGSAVPAPPPVEETPGPSDEVPATLEAYLQLRARLELEHAAAWGEPDWSIAAARVADGDRHFAQRRFAAAGREYGAGLDLLRRLEASRPLLLSEALEEGTAALARDDAGTAITRFEKALAIEPDHPEAARGLARARVRDAVVTQMALGEAAEANRDLDGAAAAYRQAAVLDAAFEPALAALDRVSEEMTARDFMAAMSRGLAALEAGRMAEAESALEAAERLRPGDPAVADAGARLKRVKARAGLERLRRKAVAAAAAEGWRVAAGLYREALAIDPLAGFALEGLRRAEARIRLHEQFDHYLERPDRLYADGPLANAEALLESTGPAGPAEPRLAEKIDRLGELVRRAGTPVPVTLSSDGATSVVLYRVGELGLFSTRHLELLPGEYTAVGRRPGYRDVRKVFKVRPGSDPTPVVVRCEEPI